MTLSAHAIVARFGGDPTKAASYCHNIMQTYPHLREEYAGYLVEITQNQWKLRDKFKPSPLDTFIDEEEVLAAHV